MKTLPLLCFTGTVVLGAIAGCENTPGTDMIISPTIGDATVDYVVDGDTIQAIVDGKSERVRLLGIDTPELGRDGTPDERCAAEARQFLADWVTDSTVTLSADPHSLERDRYDRLLAYVEIDGVDVSQTMLDEGWADLYTGNKELTHWSEYKQATARSSTPECADARI